MNDELLAIRWLLRGWLGFGLVTRRLGGVTREWQMTDHPDGAAVLPFDPVRRVGLLIMQPRLGPLFRGTGRFLEVVGGKVEQEDPETCARREALEEAGVTLDALVRVADVYATPSSSTERVRLYLAAYGAGDRADRGGGLAAEDEHIDVVEAPLAELWDRVSADVPGDAKTLILLQALRLRRPDLFE